MSTPSNQARAVFLEAIEQYVPEKRADFIERACCGDVDLRARVERLLHSQLQLGTFHGDAPPLPGTTMDAPNFEDPGAVIGPYKLLQQIGEGGMGVVYMAEQTMPVQRKVALKVIKPGMDTRQVIARFEAERQALAIMDHINIARVLDAGTTSVEPDASATGQGRPYFVMELIHGVPITKFCDDHQLTPRQRLELFVPVCQAIQHAHQKGIIHRDIKPSNVMITLYDGKPVPKVIDFGVAKAIEQKLTERTLFTQYGVMVGTLEYMSPEQAETNALGVDTRSDIYSLGVLLYELLTGSTPLSRQRVKESSYADILRIIKEEDPPKPSTRLCDSGDTLVAVSAQRQTEPAKLTKLVRGELDWIVMKTLEKDRNRRYETASAFAADVQRYLSNEPVEACPPSAVYRMRKYTRRNWRVLSMAGIIAAALVTATAVSAWQAVRAQDAESRAATEAAIARVVNDFLQKDLLGQVNTDPNLGVESSANSNLTVKEALDRAAAKIGTRFQKEPLVEAAIRMAIGEAYNSLQLRNDAVPHLERAFALRQAHLGPNHADTLSTMVKLAITYAWVARYQEAITVGDQMLENRKALSGPDHTETLTCMSIVASLYGMAGQSEISLPLYEDLVKKWSSVSGAAHASTLNAMHNLAMSYGRVGRVAESIALFEKIMQTADSTSMSEGNKIWQIMCCAKAYRRAGQIDRANQLLHIALERNGKREDSISRREQRANILGWLALNLVLQEHYDDAEPLIREAIAIFERQTPDTPRRFYWVSVLGAVLFGQEKYAEAEVLLLQGYEGMKRLEATWSMERCELTEASERVLRFYEVTDQPEKARQWRDSLR